MTGACGSQPLVRVGSLLEFVFGIAAVQDVF
jgi:hypothetical protein